MLDKFFEWYWMPALWISDSKWVQDHSHGTSSLLWLVPLWLLAPLLFWGTIIAGIIALASLML